MYKPLEKLGKDRHGQKIELVQMPNGTFSALVDGQEEINSPNRKEAENWGRGMADSLDEVEDPHKRMTNFHCKECGKRLTEEEYESGQCSECNKNISDSLDEVDFLTLDPLTGKGKEVMAALKEQYGEEEGESVFYAMKNKGELSGVDKKNWKDRMMTKLGRRK
jgi:hypothetical protein